MSPARRRIRSYRRVWRLERQIHALPLQPGRSARLPFPIPLRGVVYFAATVLTVTILDNLPAIGLLLDRLTFSTRYVMVPGLVAFFAAKTTIDGRRSHAFLRDWVWFSRRPKLTSAGRRIQHGRVRR